MSSKYDYVKVKVTVESNHYYILSRFLLARMLTFSQIPQPTAVRIALELKKLLVDTDTLEISQGDLEHCIFTLMEKYGFGQVHIQLFGTMTRFYSSRTPLIILIAGTGCSGKSTVSHMLGSVLNNHNVINTDAILELLTSIEQRQEDDEDGQEKEEEEGERKNEGVSNRRKKEEEEVVVGVSSGSNLAAAPSLSIDDDPLWLTELPNREAYLSEWDKRCAHLAHYLDADITKALSEGKVHILEGNFLSLPLYHKYFSLAYDEDEDEDNDDNDGNGDGTNSKSNNNQKKQSSQLPQHPKGIFIPFVLKVPDHYKSLLIENWLSSHRTSHLLASLLSIPQQVAFMKEKTEWVERHHLGLIEKEEERLVLTNKATTIPAVTVPRTEEGGVGGGESTAVGSSNSNATPESKTGKKETQQQHRRKYFHEITLNVEDISATVNEMHTVVLREIVQCLAANGHI